MTSEKLFDAIGFIDDDIVAEAEAFSKRKKAFRRAVATAVSLAACLVIAVFGMHILRNSPYFVLPDRGSNNMSFTASENKYAGYGGGLKGATTMGSMTSSDNAVYLEITEWKKNSFYALVLEGNSDDLSIGTKVKVKINKNIWFGNSVADESDAVCYKQGKPTEEDFPVGSKVYVVFGKIRDSFLNSKAEKVLRAESVKPSVYSYSIRGPGSMMTYYYVEVVEWYENSFKGIVKGSENQRGEIPLNEEVTVRFGENMVIRKEGGKSEHRKPNAEDFPPGTRVRLLADDMYAPEYLGTSEIWTNSIGDLTELQTLLVRIDDWNDNGFVGTLAGENGQTAFYYTNQTVVAEFTDETRMKSFADRVATTIISLAPTEEDFPVGTTVEVSYFDSAENSKGEILVTAEYIWEFRVAEFTD